VQTARGSVPRPIICASTVHTIQARNERTTKEVSVPVVRVGLVTQTSDRKPPWHRWDNDVNHCNKMTVDRMNVTTKLVQRTTLTNRIVVATSGMQNGGDLHDDAL